MSHPNGWEKGLHIVEWYKDLRNVLAATKNSKHKSNLMWLAIAGAPAGYAHIHNTVVGTLLDDITAGKDFEQCRKAWVSKVDPLKYQRAQVAPSEGQVDAAEKLVEKLGVAKAFRRRFARLDEVRNVMWTPSPAAESKQGSGVFGHLKPKTEAPKIELPLQRITWAKFLGSAVLARAKMMEIHCPVRAGYCGITTQADPEAPPILQWDKVDDRYPLTHYFYHRGSLATQWGVKPGGWSKVTAVFPAPHGNVEGSKHAHFIVFAIEGCRDSGAATAGAGIFPETLKSELHQIRAVIEAHSNKGSIEGYEDGSANGLTFAQNTEVTVRINGNETYKIDRWE